MCILLFVRFKGSWKWRLKDDKLFQRYGVTVKVRFKGSWKWRLKVTSKFLMMFSNCSRKIQRLLKMEIESYEELPGNRFFLESKIQRLLKMEIESLRHSFGDKEGGWRKIQRLLKMEIESEVRRCCIEPESCSVSVRFKGSWKWRLKDGELGEELTLLAIRKIQRLLKMEIERHQRPKTHNDHPDK